MSRRIVRFLALVLLAACRAEQPEAPRPRAIVLVSFVAGHDPTAVATDEARLRQALGALVDRGAPAGTVRVLALPSPTLARVLVELAEAGRPCGATRWRSALAAWRLDPTALLVVVGGTIRFPAAFGRRAGLTCGAADASCREPGARGGVILSDRRPVRGVDPAVVLLHEIGHAAGLPHPGQRGQCGTDQSVDAGAAFQANAMQVDAGAGARHDHGSVVTLDDVTLSSQQVARISAYLSGAAPATSIESAAEEVRPRAARPPAGG